MKEAEFINGLGKYDSAGNEWEGKSYVLVSL